MSLKDQYVWWNTNFCVFRFMGLNWFKFLSSNSLGSKHRFALVSQSMDFWISTSLHHPPLSIHSLPFQSWKDWTVIFTVYLPGILLVTWMDWGCNGKKYRSVLFSRNSQSICVESTEILLHKWLSKYNWERNHTGKAKIHHNHLL
jgi:hypothetical protein